MNQKTTNILYWISTGILALFTIPGIFFLNSQMAMDAMKQLGMPLWFHYELGIGKFIGALILIIPGLPNRLKEWAYVAFGIDMLSATIGHVAVDGPKLMSFEPLVFCAILVLSYVTFLKRQQFKPVGQG